MEQAHPSGDDASAEDIAEAGILYLAPLLGALCAGAPALRALLLKHMPLTFATMRAVCSTRNLRLCAGHRLGHGMAQER